LQGTPHDELHLCLQGFQLQLLCIKNILLVQKTQATAKRQLQSHEQQQAHSGAAPVFESEHNST